MSLTMVQIPGRPDGNINGTDVSGLGAQCPYCSKVYDEYDYSKGDPLPIPNACRRCGSPMEPGKKAEGFAAKMSGELVAV